VCVDFTPLPDHSFTAQNNPEHELTDTGTLWPARPSARLTRGFIRDSPSDTVLGGWVDDSEASEIRVAKDSPDTRPGQPHGEAGAAIGIRRVRGNGASRGEGDSRSASETRPPLESRLSRTESADPRSPEIPRS
jgi:hypothetical protein